MKRSALVDAATELNEQLGLEPEIDTKAAANDLRAKILEAAQHITEDDELSDETMTVVREVQGKSAEGNGATAEGGEPKKRRARSDQGASRGTREGSLAQYVDDLMAKGGTWEEIHKQAAAKASELGKKRFTHMGQLKRHAKRRAEAGYTVVKMDDERVQMTAPK